jgi:peptide/nickel transport system substrate-binding protein
MADDRYLLRTGFTRRGFVRFVGATAGAASVAGLVAATPGRVVAQAAGGELTVGVDEDGYRTEPNRANIGMYPLNTNIFESLVRLTPDYQVEPWLAEAWEFVEPNTWRFTLRQGVTFHDGTPFTAEAVRWSLGRIAATGGGVLGVDETSTKVVDDFTVEITPARPNRRLVEQLNHPNNSIVAPNTEPAETRVGTGPFKEVEYAAQDRYVVEANDAYWGEEKPQLSRITFRFYPDPTSRLLALQAGEVDLISEVPRESAGQLSGELRAVTSEVGAYQALYVNIHGQEPYDLGQDPAVREAVAAAIDKDAIVQGAWQGNAEPNNTMIPPGILGGAASAVEGVAHDPDRARQLLEGAGWVEGDGGVREKDGRALKLTLISGFSSAADHGSVPELVQAQLAEVGIEVEIVQTPDTATYEARLVTGEGDLWAEIGSQNDGNPCFLPDLLFASPVPGGDPESNMYGNAFAPGEAFDAFIEECRSATSTEEVQHAAANAMNLLIDEQFVVIPLASFYRIFGASERVTEFEPHPSGVNQRWTGVVVAE